MTHRFYETDKQFQQDALIFVALSLNESACVLISDGNIAEAEEIALIELINIAKQKAFDKSTINSIALYLNLVQEENNHMRQAFTKHR